MNIDVNVNLYPHVFHDLFVKAEKAVQAHPKLRGGWHDGSMHPRLHVDRFGWTVEMSVKLKGSRKAATAIQEDGETPEQAVDNLIAKLDFWAESMK